MSFRQRFAGSMLAILICIDQLALSLLVAPFALVGLARVPDPDETISGFLGRHEGTAWGRPLAALVDALFLVLTLGVEREHCRVVAFAEAMRRCET